MPSFKEKLKKGLGKAKRGLSKIGKKVLPYVAGALVGAVFPPAGAALGSILSNKLNEVGVDITGDVIANNISDIGDFSGDALKDGLRRSIKASNIKAGTQISNDKTH